MFAANNLKAMKIVYFFTSLGLTGGPMTLYNFMNGLEEKGHEVYAVTMYESFRWHKDAYKDFVNNGNKFTNRKLHWGTVACEFLLGNEISSRIMVISRLLVRNYRMLNIEADIFISTHPFTSDAVNKVGGGKIKVLHNQHFEELMFASAEDRSFIRLLIPSFFNHIVNCRWLQEMFKYNYGINAPVITPGLDEKIFGKALNKGKYHNPPIIKLVTYCDKARDFKGYKQQLEILERLCNKNCNFEITVFGHNPATKKFKYKFVGWKTQAELADLYASSHLLVMFSWYESFPLPPIEAMASGCAVVAGKYGTEDYLIDGESGIVINPFKIEESVEKICNLILHPDLLSALAERGQEMAKIFLWNDKIEEMNKYLTSLHRPGQLDIDMVRDGSLNEIDKIYG
jgi:glycosyltransferase involved in cell wall biosynthesis